MTSINNLTAVWSSNTTDYVGIGLNVSTTSANSFHDQSRFLQFKLNGNTVFGVDANGAIYSQGNVITGTAYVSTDISPAFNKANQVYTFANSVFNTLNSSFTYVNTSFDRANAAFTTANNGWGFANATNTTLTLRLNGLSSYTNTQLTSINTQINDVSSGINARLTGAWVTVNSAFGVANASFGYTNVSLPLIFNTANASYFTVNAAFGKANTALQNTSGTFEGALTVKGQLTLLNSLSAPGQITAGNINTNNVNVSGQLNAVDSAAIVGNIYAQKLYLANVNDGLSKSGYNGFLLRQNGILYSASAVEGVYAAYVNGRGYQHYAVYGLDSMRSVNFPLESGTGSQLTDSGTNGYSYAYALFSNGNLYTWGRNTYGECGLGHNSLVEVPTLAAQNVYKVYWHPSNGEYNCSAKMFIQKTDGFLYVTGYNGYGQLGLGHTNPVYSFTKNSSLGNSFRGVWNLGADFGCLFVQKSDYTIWAAGYNGWGQLGDGTRTARPTPVDVTTAWGGGSGISIAKITGGWGRYNSSESFTAMLLYNNSGTTFFKTSGCNSWGSIGVGASAYYTTPQTPNVGSGIISDIANIGGGVGSMFVLKSDGTLYAWGYNGYGQLGLGDITQRNTPVSLGIGFSTILNDGMTQSVDGYYAQTFVKKTDGYLYSTGYNGYGQLGVGDQTNRSTFTRVWLPANFSPYSLGWFASTYPVYTFLCYSTDGRLYAWGYNGESDITSDGSGYSVTTPINIKLPFGA